MAFSVGSAQQAEINVTPLIDVLLVLLIIFMVVVPLRPLGLESQVPQSSSSAERAPGPVDLRVIAGAKTELPRTVSYQIDGRRVAGSELKEALLASIRLRPARSVYVSGDADLSYEDVAAAIGAAKSAGAVTIGIGRTGGGR